jgi:hypothetical protein
MRFALVLLALFAGAPAASAAPDPCAKYSDADAYNNCLAGFGPVAAPHKVTRAPVEEPRARDEAPRATPRHSSAKPRAPDGPHPRPVAHGRMRIEFLVPSHSCADCR